MRKGRDESWVGIRGGGASSKGLEQREQFGWLPVSDSIFESGYLISACLVSERQAAESKQSGSLASPQPQPVTEGVEMSDAAPHCQSSDARGWFFSSLIHPKSDVLLTGVWSAA